MIKYRLVYYFTIAVEKNTINKNTYVYTSVYEIETLEFEVMTTIIVFEKENPITMCQRAIK